MHRSPKALLAVFFFLVMVLGGIVGLAQNNPATPTPGSDVPQTPVPNTAPSQPPAAPLPDTAPDTATQPAVEQPKSVEPKPDQPAATEPKKSDAGQKSAEQKAADQRSSDQKSADQKKTGTGYPSTAQPAATATPVPQAQPKTDILDSSATSGALVTDGHDPILDPAPVPRTTTTLVGGTITGVDRMRNRLTLHVFGGNRWTVNFDERTHIFHNGRETTQMALKKGERVYVDTQLDNNRHDIFARNIRVGVAELPADADGQIIAIDTKHNELTLRDTLNSVPVRFAVDSETRISNGQTPAAFKDVKPGTLVHVRFAASSPNRGLAREVSIIAVPGSTFTFAGKVTFLDLHRGLLAVQNSTDDKNYEIHFALAAVSDRSNLGVGRDVLVRATFEGARYMAQSVSPTRARDEDK
ncbi:MAG TPA: DUF5666 domain-containing protein [Candidatus Dormibacteraeota bacterium]|jgi:hypothetical protein|nr:DUF5666 domain-containing protein [Candidatus Dormibacteraeota bacterium]